MGLPGIVERGREDFPGIKRQAEYGFRHVRKRKAGHDPFPRPLTGQIGRGRGMPRDAFAGTQARRREAAELRPVRSGSPAAGTRAVNSCSQTCRMLRRVVSWIKMCPCGSKPNRLASGSLRIAGKARLIAPRQSARRSPSGIRVWRSRSARSIACHGATAGFAGVSRASSKKTCDSGNSPLINSKTCSASSGRQVAREAA